MESQTRNTETLVLRLVSDSESVSLFMNYTDSVSESVSYLRLKQSQTQNRDSKIWSQETLLWVQGGGMGVTVGFFYHVTFAFVTNFNF